MWRAFSLLSYTPGFLGWINLQDRMGCRAGFEPSVFLVLPYALFFSSFTDSLLYFYTFSFFAYPPTFLFLPLYHFTTNNIMFVSSYFNRPPPPSYLSLSSPPSYPFTIISLPYPSFRQTILFLPHLVTLFLPSYPFLPHPFFSALILSLILSLSFSLILHSFTTFPYISSIILFLFLFTSCLLPPTIPFFAYSPYSATILLFPLAFHYFPSLFPQLFPLGIPFFLKCCPPPFYILFSQLDFRFFGFL